MKLGALVQAARLEAADGAGGSEPLTARDGPTSMPTFDRFAHYKAMRYTLWILRSQAITQPRAIFQLGRGILQKSARNSLYTKQQE
ncbi:hypothetical protein RB195_014419 [Necator americanus]|uniref:Uncharacterized protein n=1 Tax=Necator americanus TaxID=51031 RepID=A0ABR1E1M7_NECAM